MVIGVVLELWLEGHETVLATDIDHVVDPPKNLPHSASRVPQTLQGVQQDDASSYAAANAFDCLKH